MCHLQATTHACSHTRKTLLEPCALALRLAPVSHNRAPFFCLNGLTIAQASTSTTPCGRNTTHDSHFTCHELTVLAPLLTRYAEAQSELSSYAARVDCIASCVEAGMRPECDWNKVDASLVDELKRQQDTYWTETLPMRLLWMHNMLDASHSELFTAYAMGVNDMLNRPIFSITSQLKSQLDTNYLPIPSNEVGAEHLPVQMFAQVYSALHDRVREELELLEDLALVACLDGVGWGLPMHDVQTVRLLIGRVESRDVRPVQGAVELVRWEEEKVHEGVHVGVEEEYDELDTAEVEAWC